MRGLRRVRTSSADVLREESGAALVELALILPLLLLLLLGVSDFGRVLYWSITLAQSARAGAQYGAQSSASAANSAGIQQAVLQDAQNITNLGGTINVTSECFCQCEGETASVNCTNNNCGNAPQVFVKVTTSTTFNTLVPYPGIPSTVNLSNTAILRLQ